MSKLLDQVRVILQGLDFTPRCQYPVSPEHPGQVALRCRRCGSVQVLCWSHVAQLKTWFSSQPRRVRVVQCTACQESSDDWDAIAEVLPL